MQNSKYLILVTSLFLFFFIHNDAFADTPQKNTEYVELIKNGNFNSGLDYWSANVYQDCTGPWWQQSCRTYGDIDGYPKNSVSDSLSPGTRYFVTVVPSRSENGWLGVSQYITASALQQDVDIPDAKSVMLSFKARGYSDSQLEIYVKNRDDNTKTLINQLTINDKRFSFGDYIQRTYDMTAFAGKKITLIFVSKQLTIPEVGGEDMNTAVYFYNVSLNAEILKQVQNKTDFIKTDSIWTLIIIAVVTVVTIVIIGMMIIMRLKRNFVRSQLKQQRPDSKEGETYYSKRSYYLGIIAVIVGIASFIVPIILYILSIKPNL